MAAPSREKQTGWRKHVWGVVGATPGHMQEIAQCQVESCLKFKVNDNKPYLTHTQLIRRHPDIRWQGFATSSTVSPGTST